MQDRLDDREGEQEYLRHNVGFFSEMFLTYVGKLVAKGRQQTLDLEDLYKIEDHMTYDQLYPRFEELYHQKRLEDPKKYKLGRVLLLYFRRRHLTAFCFMLSQVACEVSIPIMIKFLVGWLADPDYRLWEGLMWAALISFAFLLKVFFYRRAWTVASLAMNEYGVVLRALIFSKISKLSREAISLQSLGNLTNIIHSDTFKLQIMVRIANMIYQLPFLVIAGFVYFLIFFGWMAVLFPIFFALCIAAITAGNRFLFKYQSAMLKFSDQRSKQISECLSGIKNIKTEGWEDISIDRLQDLRKKESAFLSKYFFIRVSLNVLSELYTPLFLLIFVSIYSSLYGDIPIDKAYLLISISNMLMQPLKGTVTFMDFASSVLVALRRLNKLLEIPETHVDSADPALPKGSIEVEDLSTGWRSKELNGYFELKDDPDQLVLRRLTASFEPGKFYAIVGKVGAGKSAFLASLLGQLSIKGGRLRTNGSIAFVPQTPFLLNASVRENVVFGLPFDRQRYLEVLTRCRLADDIKVLPGGDQTEIGERGVNLSGGQKQRISLARALYADKDIYLLDDTLSALDAQVAKGVFVDVVLGQLKRRGKSIVLVTHALSVLDFADQVLLMDKGEIVLAGKFEDIKAHPLYVQYAQNRKEAEEEETKADHKDEVTEAAVAVTMSPTQVSREAADLDEFIARKEESEKKERLGKLTVKEQKQAGRVAWQVYWKYFKAFNRFLFFGSYAACCLFLGTRNLSDYWLGFWAQKRWQWTTDEYRTVYIVLVMILIFFGLSRAGMLSKGMSLVGINLNRAMMKTVFRRPIAFFESTPIGVIINRSTRELLDLDFVFNNFLQHFMATSSQFISLVVVISVMIPFTIPVFIFVVVMCVHYVKIITLVASDIKRITQIASAPMISNVAEIFNGILTIRAYDKIALLKDKFKQNLGYLASSELHEKYLENWAFMRIEFTSATIVTFTTFFAVMIKAVPIEALNDVASLSLAVSWSAISGDFIAFMLMTFSEFTKGMNSVERMLEIAESTDLEPDLDSPEPPAGWPSAGEITIRDLSMRYRPNLPLVLDSVSLDVHSKQKIGIVGRTGSGKSSFILTLMRIIDSEPPSRPDGEREPIKIDGVGIKGVGLRFARKAVTLIPQDAFVLSGTVRSNVDPYNRFTDEEVLKVLRKTRLLQSLIENSDRKLEQEQGQPKNKAEAQREDPDDKLLVSERKSLGQQVLEARERLALALEVDSGGSNLSQGQKQLLCIARALIKQPKVLLMDEATASIDSKTDEIIQELIKTQFRDSTILTIAHRLNTIITYDKILSLRDGKVVDFGSPRDLLLDKDSYFCRLVRENGEEFYEQMLALASLPKE